MSLNDAYDYVDQLKERLAEDGKVLIVTRNFKEKNENSQRIKFVQDLLSDFNLIADKGKLTLSKSNAIAESCRVRGNQFYSRRHFLDALESYNQSLCFAESASSAIGMAYANRSAVYFELQLFKNCLSNIEMARKNHYPEENLDKLHKREALCFEMIKNNLSLKREDKPIGIEHFNLSYEPNKSLPFIADCLELKADDTFGRYITTNRPLKPGDVVCVEEPFSQLLLPAHSYKYCASCLKDNFLDLFACRNCTSTMFCSVKCEQLGDKKFHKFECSIIDKLNTLSTKILRIAVRTFFEALDVCDGSLLELKALIEENIGSSCTVFDFKVPLSRRNMLQAIDALSGNEAERNQADLFQRSGVVAIISNLFLKNTLKEILVTDEDQDFFRSFVFKQSQIAACNYHGLFCGVVRKSELESNPQYGSGSFPFCSLINHSCAPNLVRVTYNCKNYVIINRPIAAGSQLFDNYGYHHCLEKFHQRQSSLLGQYMFKCLCEACTGNYPLFSDLKMIDNQFDEFLTDDIKKLSKLDVSRAKEKFQSYCYYLSKVDRHYPSYEISSVQECLMRCFTLFTMTDFKLKLCH